MTDNHTTADEKNPRRAAHSPSIPLAFPRRTREGARETRRAAAPPAPTSRSASIGVLVPGITLPRRMSGYRPQDVGLLTHATLAIITPVLNDVPKGRLVEYVLDVTGGLVNGEPTRRRALQQQAASHVCTYLRRFAPSGDWVLHGAEFQTGYGRTDLAWRNTATGEMFFDEVKTHSRAITALADDVLDQCRSQANGGANEFDDLFLGVRIIPLGSLHLTALVSAVGTRELLDPTSEQPLRTRTQALLVASKGVSQ